MVKQPATVPDGGRQEEEAALVARARAGDTAALDALIAAHLEAVYRLTSRMLGDSELAADAAQDTWVNALRGLPSFRGQASFRTWLLRIAANAALSAGRRQSRRRERALDGVADLPSNEPGIAEAAAKRAEAARVAAAIAQLPEKQRLAVSLRVDQELSYREIGEIAGCSEGAARVSYHLGVKRLRELLG